MTAPRERPLLFSTPMVRAILDGRKTQTRRMVTTRHPLTFIGSRGDEANPSDWGWFFDGPDHNGYMVLGRGHDERHDHGRLSIPCPYGDVGDRLWVRETWTPASREHHSVADYPADGRPRDAYNYWAWYAASDEVPWTPSIFMPRWASRIKLEVTEVRVQRLHEISDEDARAEGVEAYTPQTGHISPDQRVPGPGFDDCRLGDQPYRLPFADLWDSINGKPRALLDDDGNPVLGDDDRPIMVSSRSWANNPWVWAITFRRLP